MLFEIFNFLYGYYYYYLHNFASHQKCNKLLFTNFLISASASSSSRWCSHHSSSASPMLEFTGGKQTIFLRNAGILVWYKFQGAKLLEFTGGKQTIFLCNAGILVRYKSQGAIQNMFLCKTPFNQLFLIFHTWENWKDLIL